MVGGVRAYTVLSYNIFQGGWERDGCRVDHVTIAQGEYSASDDPDTVITTVLGSCVAACVRDPKARLGGMNHYVLPQFQAGSKGDPTRYGSYLMQRLIDHLLEQGASLKRLEAQVFGGASPGPFHNSIGQNNVDFAMRYLAERGISTADPVRSGVAGCKLEFWPASGRVVHTPLTGVKQAVPTRIMLRPVKPLMLPPAA